jgi:hypothetical protein
MRLQGRVDTDGWVTYKSKWDSGVGEIRTHEGLAPLAVFKTAAFNHSATTPGYRNLLIAFMFSKRKARA